MGQPIQRDAAASPPIPIPRTQSETPRRTYMQPMGGVAVYAMGPAASGKTTFLSHVVTDGLEPIGVDATTGNRCRLMSFQSPFMLSVATPGENLYDAEYVAIMSFRSAGSIATTIEAYVAIIEDIMIDTLSPLPFSAAREIIRLHKNSKPYDCVLWRIGSSQVMLLGAVAAPLE